MSSQALVDDSDASRATFFLVVGFCAGLGLGIAAMMSAASDPENASLTLR